MSFSNRREKSPVHMFCLLIGTWADTLLSGSLTSFHMVRAGRLQDSPPTGDQSGVGKVCTLHTNSDTNSSWDLLSIYLNHAVWASVNDCDTALIKTIGLLQYNRSTKVSYNNIHLNHLFQLVDVAIDSRCFPSTPYHISAALFVLFLRKNLLLLLLCWAQWD